MTNTIKLTIQEIVTDFYNLADTEGYLSGKADCYALSDKDKIEYFNTMKELIEKYIPTYKNHLSEKYKSMDFHDKGFELSKMLNENFREIFYKLV